MQGVGSYRSILHDSQSRRIGWLKDRAMAAKQKGSGIKVSGGLMRESHHTPVMLKGML